MSLRHQRVGFVGHSSHSIPLRAAASSSGLKVFRDMSVTSRAWWETSTPTTYYADALQQLRAVQGALSKISAMILRSHVKHYVTNAVLRGDVTHTVAETMEPLKDRG